MTLFTDGQINGIQDLQRYENAVLNVTTAESIDVAGKLRIAQDEIGDQLLLYILRLPLRDTQAATRRIVGVSDVVVTDPLRRWHALRTLGAIYRDAYNNQLNDRYLGKWTEYEKLSHAASTDYLQIGVGLVADPVPKAESPELESAVGNAGAATYYVATSWVNSLGQEGAPSEVGVIVTTDGTQLVVSTSNPPNNAVGWNVYVGASAAGITLQNSSPNPVGGTWALSSAGTVQGTPPTGGQTPERYLIHDRQLQRG